MSFGSGGGSGRHSSSSSFGGKGSAQRKERKKKQEFHKHKIKFVEEQRLDFDQLKTRTKISLEKIGQQLFSMEAGGYTLQDWMKSLNFLLDDFEEKADSANLPKEYFDKRLELTADLLKPPDTSEIDHEIEAVRKEEQELSYTILKRDIENKRVIADERTEANSKMDALKRQQRECANQLEMEKSALEERKKMKNQNSASSSTKTSFFKRLFLSSKNSDPNSAEAISRRIKEHEERIEELDKEVRELQQERNSKTASIVVEEKLGAEDETAKLETLRFQIGELEARKAEKMQLAEKRREVALAIADAISKIQLNLETMKSNGSGSNVTMP